MTIFTPEQRQRIEAAIRKAEAGTSAEFLCAVARNADTYFAVPLIIAAIVAIGLPITVFNLMPGWPVFSLHDPGIMILQFAVFAILGQNSA